jgi:tape measure domain-containing protein
MADIGLTFTIKADSKQAVEELKKFRQNFATQLGEFQKSGSSSFSKFERDASGSVKGVERVAKQSFTQIEREAQTSASSMARSFLGGLSSIAQTVAGVFGGNLLTGALSKLGSGLKSEITAGFDFLDLQERSKIAFATIFRNAGLSAEEAATKATEHLKELVDFGAKTPFRSQQLIELSQQLQAVGFKAEEVVPMLTKIGDAVAGLGGDPQKLDRIILQLGQIKTKGKVSGEELTALAENSIPAWKYLAEYAGKSIEQVQKLAQQNKLDADVAVKVIVAGMGRDFEGMMKATEGTYSSMWSTIEDLNQQRAAEAFKPAFDEVKKGQAAAIAGLSSGAAEGFTKSAAAIQKVILGGCCRRWRSVGCGRRRRRRFDGGRFDGERRNFRHALTDYRRAYGRRAGPDRRRRNLLRRRPEESNHHARDTAGDSRLRPFDDEERAGHARRAHP